MAAAAALPDQGFDAIVVGGGPAGTSAALLLGRCRRRVAVFDAGSPRNASARRSYGVFSRDGAPADELLRVAREQLARYAVHWHDRRVVAAARIGERFEIETDDGARYRARKLVLATGIRDRRPRVAGVDALHGTSIWPCPYCDGWEVRERALAAYARGPEAAEFALAVSTWSDDVVLLTDGDGALDPASDERLRRNGIRWIPDPLERVDGQHGRLQRVVFADGRTLARDAMFYHLGFEQASDLPMQLGCAFDDRGLVRTSHGGEQTSVPGLYVVGDASHDAKLIAVAAAEGVKAAIEIHKQLRVADTG